MAKKKKGDADLSAQDLAMVQDDSMATQDDVFDELTPEEQAYVDADMAGMDPPEVPDQQADEGDGSDGGQTQTETEAETATEAEAGVLDGTGEGGEEGDEGSEAGEEGEDGKQRYVNHGAFHKERERRKQAEERIASLEQQITKGNERLQTLTELMSGKQAGEQEGDQKQEEDDPAPDPEEDIFGYAKWQGRQIEKLQSKLSETEKSVESTNQQFEQRDSRSALLRDYAKDAQSYMEADAPDFMDAYNHLVSSRDRELTRLGYDDAQERARLIAEEEETVVRKAFERGERPAAVLYDAARERGFTPSEKAQNGADTGEGSEAQSATNGAGGRTQGSQGGEQSDAASKVETIARGQQASKSLSNAGGGDVQEIDMLTLANMSDEEFNEFAEKNPGQVDRILGKQAT